MYFDNPHLAFSGGNSGVSHCAAYAAFSSRYGNQFLRSIFLSNQTVEIAGREHSRRKICRHASMPLAVTNSDSLRPVLKEQLAAWSGGVHASVVAYREAEEAARREEHRTRWVKVLEFPERTKSVSSSVPCGNRAPAPAFTATAT